ncbi:MAG: potassium channel family protein, partial [Planctomycetota bacterium]|nr:potassium channel family protein [Planctomycetota bacterium]
LWWSFTTVVTGGFGDIHNPETPGGQLLTAILIVTGMVLVGVFTATLTSLFIGEQAEEIEKLQEELSQRLDQLANRIENRDGPDFLDET